MKNDAAAALRSRCLQMLALLMYEIPGALWYKELEMPCKKDVNLKMCVFFFSFFLQGVSGSLRHCTVTGLKGQSVGGFTSNGVM